MTTLINKTRSFLRVLLFLYKRVCMHSLLANTRQIIIFTLSGFTLLCFLSAYSCGNRLYYDKTNNSICSCSGSVYSLSISDTAANGDHWAISPKPEKALKCLPLYPTPVAVIRNNYTITNYPNAHDSSFVLKPSRSYLVSYSSGDMAPGDFYLITDASGNIVSATKTSCK